MIKVFLVFSSTLDKKDLHERIYEAMDFPEYYGNNLDALYDCLTDIVEDTCVGIYYSPDAQNYEYIRKIIQVFEDAEDENEHLVFFTANLVDNRAYKKYHKSPLSVEYLRMDSIEEEIVETQGIKLKEVKLRDVRLRPVVLSRVELRDAKTKGI